MGSEMCIRDSPPAAPEHVHGGDRRGSPVLSRGWRQLGALHVTPLRPSLPAGIPWRLERIQRPARGSLRPDSQSESVGWRIPRISLTKSRE